MPGDSSSKKRHRQAARRSRRLARRRPRWTGLEAIEPRLLLSGAPDLVITAAEGPAFAYPGQTYQFSVTVQNIGDAVTTSPIIDVDAVISDDATINGGDRWLILTNSNTALGSGESVTITWQATVPGDTTEGSKQLIFRLDDYWHQESNLTNNQFIIPIEIAGIDLAVTDIASPDAVTWNQPFEVSWTVQNVGDDPVPLGSQWNDLVKLEFGWLSEDLLWTEPVVVGSALPSTLGPGEQYTVTRTVSTLRRDGSFVLNVYTGTDQDRNDTDFTNNKRSRPIHVYAPDIHLDSFDAPSTLSVNQLFEVKWSVTVAGPSDISNGDFIYDRLFLSQDTIWDNADRSIEAARIRGSDFDGSYDRQVTFTMPGDVEPGNYYLLMVSDGEEQFDEPDESNNVLSSPIVVRRPDLALSNAQVPAVADWYEQVVLHVDLANVGTGDAFASALVRAYWSRDEQLDASDKHLGWGEPQTTPMASGEQRHLTVQGVIPKSNTGSGFVIFVADRENKQSELDETNNLLAVPITIATGPDFVVSEIVAPISAVWGQTIDLSWTTRNIGESTAPVRSREYIYLSTDAILDASDLKINTDNSPTPYEPNIDAGESQTYFDQVLIPRVEGTDYHLLIVADGANSAVEENEQNNVRSIPIHIDGGADLVITDVIAPDSVLAGEPFDVWVQFTNQGDVWAPAPFRIASSIFPQDSENPFFPGYNTTYALGVQPGESVWVSYPMTGFPPIGVHASGDYTLVTSIDTWSNQPESDETNNLFEHAIHVGIPDLAVTDVTVIGAMIPGNKVDIYWTVTNLGTDDVHPNARWIDMIYLLDDAGRNLFDNQFLGWMEFNPRPDSADPESEGMPLVGGESFRLPAGESYTRHIRVTAPVLPFDSGHVIVMTGTYPWDIFDSDATNNSLTTAELPLVDPQKPDLTGYFNIDAILDAMVPGEKVRVPFTLINNGTRPVDGPVEINLYASADNILDDNDRQVGSINKDRLKLGAEKTTQLKFDLTIDDQWTTGEYFFIAEIVPLAPLDEVDPDNNIIATAAASSVDWVFGYVGGRNIKLTAPDANGVLVTFKLTGGGFGRIVGGAGFDQIILEDSTIASSLTITSRGPTSVGDILADDPLASIKAATTSIRGDMLIDGGLVKSVQFQHFADEHLFRIGAAGDPDAAVTLQFQNVDDLTIKSATNIKSLKVGVATDLSLSVEDGNIGSITADQWIGGAIEAGQIKSISVKQDFSADVTVTDADALYALGAITVKGWFQDGAIESAGRINNATFGGVRRVEICAGMVDEVYDPFADVSLFAATHAEIGKLTIKGFKDGGPSFIDSMIAAYAIGKASLGEAETSNAGDALGLVADYIGSYTRNDPLNGKIKFSRLSNPGQLDVTGDYQLRLV